MKENETGRETEEKKWDNASRPYNRSPLPMNNLTHIFLKRFERQNVEEGNFTFLNDGDATFHPKTFHRETLLSTQMQHEQRLVG